MTDTTTHTPSQLLVYAADISDDSPLQTLTSAGAELQRAFSVFLRNAGIAQAEIVDIQADLLTLIPHLVNATVLAEHQFSPCVACSKKLAVSLATEILQDAIDQVKVAQNAGGVH